MNRNALIIECHGEEGVGVSPPSLARIQNPRPWPSVVKRSSGELPHLIMGCAAMFMCAG